MNTIGSIFRWGFVIITFELLVHLRARQSAESKHRALFVASGFSLEPILHFLHRVVNAFLSIVDGAFWGATDVVNELLAFFIERRFIFTRTTQERQRNKSEQKREIFHRQTLAPIVYSATAVGFLGLGFAFQIRVAKTSPINATGIIEMGQISQLSATLASAPSGKIYE